MIVTLTWGHVAGAVSAFALPVIAGYLRSRDRAVKASEAIIQQKEEVEQMKREYEAQKKHCEDRRKDLYNKLEDKADKEQFIALDLKLDNANKKIDDVLKILIQWKH